VRGLIQGIVGLEGSMRSLKINHVYKRKGMEWKGKDRKGTEWIGEDGNGKERTGTDRRGMERNGFR